MTPTANATQRTLDFDADQIARRDGLREGRKRRDAAHFVLLVRRERFVRAAQRQMLLHLLEYETATIDNVRAVVSLPEDIAPCLFGPSIRALSVGGLIERVGFEQTSRPVAHARENKVWRLTERQAALDWLRDHPDMLQVKPDSGVTT